jgi:nitrogenase molybdenum-iron protein alpha chain
MSVFNSSPEVEIRERRVHSVISYEGTAKDLNEKSKARSVAFVERSYNQCSNCAEGCTHTQLHIRNTAVICHAPIGCDGGQVMRYHLAVRSSTAARGREPFETHTLSTNISEDDTIFGAAEKLRDAISEADRRYSPEAIFITTSCASGIIGEDIESVADEMQEELGYPIVPIYCEGFKSQIWSTGFDAALHGILRKLVKPPKKRQEDLVNVINFEGSDTFTTLLSRMNLRGNYVVPLLSLQELETVSEAKCSVSICETLSMYFAAVLEEQYGVPEIKAPSPFGLDWTDSWLRALGKATGREELAEKVIKEEHARYNGEIEELRRKLEGKTVYVFSGDSFAHNLANVAKDLGMVVIGGSTLHHDLITDNPESVNSLHALVESVGDVPNFTVCNQQPYIVIKLLKRLKPDFLICRHNGLAPLGAKLGIPSLFEADANYSIGYEGVVKMGRRFYEAWQSRKILENIVKYSEIPYTDWWLNEENPFYFVEEAAAV